MRIILTRILTTITECQMVPIICGTHILGSISKGEGAVTHYKFDIRIQVGYFVGVSNDPPQKIY